MRKIMVCLLALVLTINLFGCGMNLPADKEDPTQSGGEVTTGKKEDREEARLRDAKVYHEYLTSGALEEVLDYMNEEYAKIETCLLDMNDDGTYELLLTVTDTEHVGIRGSASKSVLYAIQKSQVVELSSASYSGGSMGGHYLQVRYDNEKEKHVVVYTGVFRAGAYEYTGSFAAYSYSFKKIKPYYTAENGAYPLDSDYYQNDIAKIKSKTDLYEEDDVSLRYYQLDGKYVSKEAYSVLDTRFTVPTDVAYLMKEGTMEDPLCLEGVQSGDKPAVEEPVQTEPQQTEPQTQGDQATIDVLNELLDGLSVPYNRTRNEKVSEWTDEDVYDYIYGKLLNDYYGKDNSRLQEMGLTYRNDESEFFHYDLKKVQKLTEDTLGRSLPENGNKNWAYISGDEFLISPAAGEATEYCVQNYTVRGDSLVAVGTIIRYGGYSSIEGHFEAVVKENSSGIYGYTLVSVKNISGNQDFSNLTATASSVLENSKSYAAANAVDGNEKTAWVEGVTGDGIGEWLKISTQDGSKMELTALEFRLGYHKSDSLLEQNGAPIKLLLEFEDGTKKQLEYVYYYDAVLLDKTVKTSWVKITILDAEAGTVYNDTCISEIILYGLST